MKEDCNWFMGEPPRLLSRDNFFIWKHRMITFLKCVDSNLLETIKERRFDALDDKAKHVLIMSIPDDIFHFVINCNSAKEIWETLGVLFEGTDEVRECKKSLLVQQYELFSAKANESLTETYIRFNCLLNDLKQHDTTFDNKDMLGTFLESLPSGWSKVSLAIRHSKDLSKMSLQDLYGKLLIHEFKINQKQARGKETQNTCMAAKQKKTNTRPHKEEGEEEEVSEEDIDGEKAFQDLNETMAMLAMKLGRVTMRTGYKPEDQLTLERLSKCVTTMKNLDTLLQSVGSNLKERRLSVKDSRYCKAKYQKLKAKKERNFVLEDADWASTSSD